MNDEFERYDAQTHTSLAAALSRRDADEWITAGAFTELDACVAEGKRRVCYLSHLRETPEGTVMFWITDRHAEQLGEVLAGAELDAFMLCLTRFDHPSSIDTLVRCSPGARIAELTISHKSGDEETAESMRAIARAARHFGCRKLAIWCAEYETDAVEALGEELLTIDDPTGLDVEVCDTTLPDGEDAVSAPALQRFLQR